jgi:peptidoglycan hydrolase-like protein with peptidoglycan-binding domain
MKTIIKRLAVMAVAVAFFVPLLVGAQNASFTRDLGLGSSGTDVTRLQTFLEAQGYLKIPPGIAKGYYGGLTRSAVAAWQAAVGLPTVGRFGPASRAKAATVATPNAPIRTGATANQEGCAAGRVYNSVTGERCSVSAVASTKSYGDANGDGKVDFNDMVLYAQNSGGAYNSSVDFNGDGVVNVFDLAILSNNYNKTVGKTTNITGGDLTNAFARAASVSTFPGDATNDGKTNFDDLVKLAQSMNSSSGQSNFNSAADFNKDNVVDVFDLAILSNNYNKSAENVARSNVAPSVAWTFDSQSISANTNSSTGYTSSIIGTITLRAKPMGDSMIIPKIQDFIAQMRKTDGTILGDAQVSSVSVSGDQTTFKKDQEYTVTLTLVGSGDILPAGVNMIYIQLSSLSATVGSTKLYQTTGLETFKTGLVATTRATPTVAKVAGDVNGDGSVNKTDLDLYAASDTRADLNNDGKVDFSDMVIIAQNYNTGVELTSKMPGYAGDATGDSKVDFNDLVKVGQAFNSSYGQSAYNLLADFNLDGKVDYIDQGIMAKNYNTTGPAFAARRAGDVNGDGAVDTFDTAQYNNAKDSNVGQAAYNFNADFNRDGKVDFSDMVVIAQNYGSVQGASASCVVITNTLAKGSTDATSGGEVTVLQVFLETQGFSFPDKGVFGALTENAVASWQTTNGISATGTVGPLTREAIRAKSCQ